MDMQNPRRGNGTGSENHRTDDNLEPTPTFAGNQSDLPDSADNLAVSISKIGDATPRIIRQAKETSQSNLKGSSGAYDNRKFYCLPTRALRDKRLTSLDQRVLGVIALHDGMSLEKKKGKGCCASLMKLKSLVDCDYTNISKSITKLTELGYLVRSVKPKDGRGSIYRVVYTQPGSWSDGQPTYADRDGDPTNNTSKVVGNEFSETRKKPAKTRNHYIPSNGTKESADVSSDANRHPGCSFSIPEVPGRNRERQAAISPYTVSNPDIAVWLSRIEKDFNNRCSETNLPAWIQWLTQIAASHDNREYEGERASDWAARLLKLPFVVEFVQQTSGNNIRPLSECGV